ncbi:MAG: tRNA glutamyl-Q(34) synthetase GluQRS [bacterium]|nr:tRNA glutamyl-Q(34) synthetase GluQRS [bacterium]
MSDYRGRFAPTPSGPLHFGSLVGALGSYLAAKSQSGAWLLRIDDLDGPRVVKGAIDQILRRLEAFGLFWDESVRYQSQRYPEYQAALDQLIERGLAYPCHCSRSQLGQSSQAGIEGPVYPGTCRLTPGAGELRSYRLLTQGAPLVFEDGNLGVQRLDLAAQVGDFVLWRADGVFSYHLATVVDEQLDGITELVRGADLLVSTQRHLFLMDLLRQPRPRCLHLPVALDAQGEKLSKQTLAPPLEPGQEGRLLFLALEFLGQFPPEDMRGAPPAELLAWGVAHWMPQALGGQATRLAP